MFFLGFIVVLGLFYGISSTNYRPIIGILTQPTGTAGRTYIAGSYVKFIEQSGGQVVPLPYTMFANGNVNGTRLLDSINGALFPGGGASLGKDSPYQKAQENIFKYIIKKNDEKVHFPLWATCLGFQSVMEIVSEDYDILHTGFDSWNISMKLDITDVGKKARMFSGPRGELSLQDAITRPITMNNHHSGVLTDVYQKNAKLTSFFNLISTNSDRKGLNFVSSVEGKEYPIYAVQYHPEKNNFEWTRNEGIDHTLPAVQFSQQLSNFFVQEARKNDHQFSSVEEESKSLIYNYCPEFTQPRGSDFTVQYYFNEETKTENR